MKKVTTFLLTTAFLAGVFVSCSEDDAEEVNVSSKGIIQGKVEAQLDLRNDTLQQVLEPVAGVNIYARISTIDLTTNADPNFNYPSKVYSTTTDANGNYEFSILATAEGSSVEIYGDDFRDDVILDTTGAISNTLFTLIPVNASVIRDQVKIIDLQY